MELAALDRRRLTAYLVVPLALGAALVGLYFSGIPALQDLAAPAHQREYGLVENLQNLLLVLIAVRALRAAGREASIRLRLGGRLLAAFAAAVLLEEIDWGHHYYVSATGNRLPPGEHFNIHNQGNTTNWIKLVVDSSFVLAFVVLPFVAGRLPERVRAWVPSRFSVLTAVVGVATSRTAHALEDAGVANNGALHSNISEFREVFVYWIAWLYLGEIARRRASPASQLRHGPSDAPGTTPADGP